jgi:hypothetical protein
MSHLRTIQTGKHGDLTQRLLNEVAAARICLLDPKRRVAYDQQLRATLRVTGAMNAVQQPASSSAANAVLQTSDQWDELLGDPTVKPIPRRTRGKPAGTDAVTGIAAKRAVNNWNVPIGIAVAAAMIAAIGIGLFAANRQTNGTLLFDWPVVDHVGTTVTVDDVAIPVAVSGPWEYHGPAGPHHIVAQCLAHKLDTTVDIVAGEKRTILSDWKPKATLVLNWPSAQRGGSELTIDGRTYPFTLHEPLEIAVEPGRHLIQITRPPAAPMGAWATVAADGRELVPLVGPPPPTTSAKLIIDLPAEERNNAELTVDGHGYTVQTGTDGSPIELSLDPGRHVVHITRTGFKPFNQTFDLAAADNKSLKPRWMPVPKTPTTPAIADTPVSVAPVETTTPQPVKKQPIPAAAEQEKIAKQLNDLYKTSQAGPKDAAKAQELYDVAAKDGSSPAERYMLLMKGAEIAAAAGNLSLSLQGIDTLDADYEIDALETKQKLLDKFIIAGKPDQVASAIPTVEQLVDQAIAADRYDIAGVLATSASKAVVKSKIATHKEVEERLTRRRRDVHMLAPIQVAAKKAQEMLDKKPADPEANLTVGRWLCFYKQDWTVGLPLLAKGSDEQLKAIAEQEAKAPAEADERVKLADAWWDLAQKEAGLARDSLHLHAGEIYQAAMPNLASALQKAAIEQRLAKIAAAKSPVETAGRNSIGGTVMPHLGKAVDLLAVVDIERDTSKGHWTRQGSTIVSDDQVSTVTFPTEVTESCYELSVDFSRDRGDGCFVVSFPVGSTGGSFTLCTKGSNGHFSGLELIDGERPDHSANPTGRSPSTLQNGQKYAIRILVKVHNDNAEINCFLNQDQLVAWKGNVNSLNQYNEWKIASHRAGISEWHSPATVYGARLKRIVP